MVNHKDVGKSALFLSNSGFLPEFEHFPELVTKIGSLDCSRWNISGSQC